MMWSSGGLTTLVFLQASRHDVIMLQWLHLIIAKRPRRYGEAKIFIKRSLPKNLNKLPQNSLQQLLPKFQAQTSRSLLIQFPVVGAYAPQKLRNSHCCVPFTATFSKRRKIGSLWSERCDEHMASVDPWSKCETFVQLPSTAKLWINNRRCPRAARNP